MTIQECEDLAIQEFINSPGYQDYIDYLLSENGGVV